LVILSLPRPESLGGRVEGHFLIKWQQFNDIAFLLSFDLSADVKSDTAGSRAMWKHFSVIKLKGEQLVLLKQVRLINLF